MEAGKKHIAQNGQPHTAVKGKLSAFRQFSVCSGQSLFPPHSKFTGLYSGYCLKLVLAMLLIASKSMAASAFIYFRMLFQAKKSWNVFITSRSLTYTLIFTAFTLVGCKVFAQSATYTTAGTHTVTVPAGVTSVAVQAWGAGGGGSTITSNNTRGGGGGGGAYASGNVAVTPGNTYNIVVGAGGTANTAGGNSTFNTNSVRAAGGSGATSNSTLAGAGGTVANSIGTVRNAGGNGANGNVTAGFSGGGGGGGGTTGGGGNAAGSTGGTGATAGGGNGASGVNNTMNGNNGNQAGGGGSGSSRGNSGSVTGGRGADGQVTITWACPTYSLSSVSNLSICPGATANIILNSTPAGLPVGTYVVSYSLSAPNAFIGTANMTVSSVGTGSFSTGALANAGATTISILQLSSGSPACSNIISSGNTATITVNPLPSVTNASLTQTICSGNTSVPVTLTSSVPGATFTWIASATAGVSGFTANGSGDIPAQTISTTGTTQGTVTYVITPSASGCTGPTTNYTILVNPLPVVSNATLSQTICSGSASALVTLTSNISGTTFSWTATASAGITGFTPSGTGNIPAQTISNSGAATGTVTFVVTPTAAGCPGASVNYTITVYPVSSVIDPSDQTLCAGANTAAVNFSGTGSYYKWTNSNISIGLAASGTGNIASFTALNAGNTTQVATITVTPVYSNAGVDCDGIPQTFTINVNATPTVLAIPASQMICPGAAITQIDITNPNNLAGTTYSWTRNNTVVLTGIAASGTSTIINGTLNSSTPGTNQTTTFSITATAGGCSSQTTAAVTVGDNTAPSLTCPGNMTATTSSSGCSEMVTTSNPVFTDNCSMNALTWTMTGATVANSAATGINNIGSYAFNAGVTTVTYTAFDAAGLTATCRFTVTVTDNDAPTIACPSPVTAYTNTNCTATGVNLGTPVTTDNCSVGSVTNNAPAAFPLGNTTVRWTVTDGGGNTATCDQTVTVLDNTPPIKPSLSPVMAQCSVTLPNPTTTDNCAGVITGTTTTVFPITTQGQTIVTWTFTDPAGNSVTADQIVNIQDNVAPVWSNPAFFTTSINSSCEADQSPLATGTPTATDNCSPVNVTFTDIITPGGCPGQYTISRTWTATDLYSNARSDVQTIFVNDNIKPVLTCRDTTVVNPDAIFPPFPPRAISFTDNCGIDTVMLYDEYFTFDNSGGAGFCPKTVVRKYIVYDQCGNTSNTCTQTIFVTSPGDCEVCQDVVPYFLADLNHHPDSTWIFEGKDVPKRIGQCCATADPNPSWACISFNVYLDKDAVGLVMDVEKPAPSGVEYYRVDCGDPIPLGEIICLTGGRFYTLTFCKPGDDRPNYIIQSISGAVTPDSLTTRADVKCFGQLHVSGLVPSSINWSVKYPAGANYLLHYLDTTDIANPTFYPDSITPALIIYQVCGTLVGAPKCEGTPMTDCADIIVSTLPPVRVNLDVDLTAICENDIPLITALVPNENPAYTYVFQWYNGPNGSGSMVGTGRTYQPTTIGTYSVRVTETTSGIGCSQDLTNFNISYDRVGPILLVPPDSLILDCSNANVAALTLAWLGTAHAYDDIDTTASIQVFNDYVFRDPQCNLAQTVHFWAFDICNNRSIDSAVIYFEDRTLPVFTSPASNMMVDCSTTNPSSDPTYLAWLANHGGAMATDDCDDTLTWTNNTATQNWSGNPANNQITITFTATDDCGNSVQTTATFTVIDDEPPTITCPASVSETAAPNNCSKTLVTLTNPVMSDVCSVPVLTYVRSLPGGGSDSGTGSVTGLVFPAGTTIVTYTATDAAGLTATCSFDVTILDLNAPTFTAGCPADVAAVPAEPGVCDAFVNIPVPPVSDPCNEGYTVTNSYTGTNDASGRYPVGTTIVTWTITDSSGNLTTCQQHITVVDLQVPSITCPANQEELITNGGCSKTNVTITDPTYGDNCAVTTLTWVMSGATVNSSPATGINSIIGQTFNVGITTVTFTAADAAGNTATCSFTVWTKNLIAPQFQATCPADVNVNVGGSNCNANVVVPAPAILNPCNELYTITNNAPVGDGLANASGVYPTGTTIVHWIITDASGNITTCDQRITVLDNIPPTISCPADQEELITNGGCSKTNVTITDPTYGDNCAVTTLTWVMSGATVNSSPATGINSIIGQTFNVGITTVTFTAADEAGNTATCSFTVWTKNLIAPQFHADCPADVVVNTGVSSCDANVIVPAPAISNPCNEAYTITNNSPVGDGLTNASGVYPPGTTTIHWIITDASGNVTTCDQDVTVADDIPPTINCPADMEDLITNGGCSKVNLTVTDPTYSDNCGVVTLTWAMTGATTGNSNPTGINTVIGQTFNVGVTTVTFTAYDVAGNSAACSFNVWTKNLVAPQFSATCPANVNVNTDAGRCDANVAVPPPAINNPCNEAYTITNNAPVGDGLANASGIYPPGTTTIHWIITDASGNITTCDQDITVTDNVPPTINCPADMEDLITDGGCSKVNLTVTDPTYSDNCSVESVSWVMTGATTGSSATTGFNSVIGQTFNVGITTVTFTATDIHDNTSSCSFTVWTKNLAAPQFQATCPNDVTVNSSASSCDANVIVPAPAISNPCNEAFTITNNSPVGDGLANASGVYPPGTTTIHWVITDASGNITTCDQDITVTDNVPPTITCPANMEDLITNGGCSKVNLTVTDPTYSDNCGVVTLTWAMTGATIGNSDPTGINSVIGQTFNVGVTTVTFTAYDAAGNSASCSFTVWTKNLVTPQFQSTCPADVTVAADPGRCDAAVIVPSPGIINPCNEAYTVSNNSPFGTDTINNASGTYPIGTTVVHWIITDASGNVKTCDQNITVTDLLPSLTCPPDQVVNADYEKPFASRIDPGTPVYSDNCPGLILTWVASNPTPGASVLTGINIDTVSIYNVGVTTITYTLNDAHNHTVSCSFTITVLAKPVIICPDSIGVCTDAGVCTRTLDPGFPTKVSGVEPIVYTWEMTGANTGTGTGAIGNHTFNTGLTTITWTATNISGFATCDQKVNVIDCEPPVFDAAPKSFCVNNIITAVYNGAGDINPTRPDYFLFKPGDTSLDVTGIADNCCVTADSLHWRIDFVPVPNPTPPPLTITATSISGTGQPSAHTGDLELPGDGVTFNDMTHTITYWLTDCAGNIFGPVTVNLVIRPRPNLIKITSK